MYYFSDFVEKHLGHRKKMRNSCTPTTIKGKWKFQLSFFFSDFKALKYFHIYGCIFYSFIKIYLTCHKMCPFKVYNLWLRYIHRVANFTFKQFNIRIFFNNFRITPSRYLQSFPIASLPTMPQPQANTNYFLYSRTHLF